VTDARRQVEARGEGHLAGVGDSDDTDNTTTTNTTTTT